MALIVARPYEYHGHMVNPAKMPNGDYTEEREETCQDCGWDREITIVVRGRRRYRSTLVGMCGCTVAV